VAYQETNSTGAITEWDRLHGFAALANKDTREAQKIAEMGY